ncbi:MAG: PilZ domain-containing protein [Gammaproteobacteria bacterium]|nr:PilZ domain-containing protein [Gammaproteobacteria bacterium]
MAAELRKYPRINTALEINYSIDDSTDMPSQFVGTVTDLSKSGAGLLVDHAHRPDDRVSLEGVGGARKPLSSVVKWVRKTQGKYRIGVKFIRTPA